jgi:cyclopropane fatty-acyl-phospholipid synthase-like methyltransferase
MKNRDFFYQQYDKINWSNQDKTQLNITVYRFIIDKIISNKKKEIKLFEIGAGIGFFIRLLKDKYGDKIYIEGCEPSKKSYEHFINSTISKNNLNIHKTTFQEVKTDTKFDFITAIYVFPHFIKADLSKIAIKISKMLNKNGKFVLVVSNEEYLREKLRTKSDLFIEKNVVEFKGKKYKEYLHYVEISQMGTVIDYDREEVFYKDLLEDNGLKLVKKDKIKSDEYICTVFTFVNKSK